MAGGASIGLPAFVGLALIIGFAALYRALEIQPSFSRALMASFDITTLVGYTKHSATSSPSTTQIFYALNMVLSLWWYAIFVPTVINRISRVRS